MTTTDSKKVDYVGEDEVTGYTEIKIAGCCCHNKDR